MTLISVVHRDRSLTYEGAPSYVHRADPFRAVDRTLTHSLAAGWQWHGDAIDIFGDRLGVIPIFYHATSDRLTLSNSLAELARFCRTTRWDCVALAVFLRLGYFIADDTPLAGIKVLPAGLKLRLTAHTPLTPPARRLPAAATAPPPDEETASRQYAELFSNAVAERLTDVPFALPLSGGRDSRHILFELASQGRRPAFALTESGGDRGKNELAIAADLCQRLDIRHVEVRRPRDFPIDDEIEKDGCLQHLALEHAWYLGVVRRLRREGAAHIFDGIGGDVLSNGLFYDDRLHAALGRADSREAANIVLGDDRGLPYLEPTLQTALAWEVARDRLAQEIARHLDTPNPTASFHFWNRTCRSIGLQALVLGSALDPSVPYVAPELLAFLSSLPGEVYGRPGFHDRVIRERFPEYAALPFSNSLPRIPVVRDFGERVQHCHFALKAARHTHVSLGFVALRLPRLLATSSDQDDWWLRPLTYLHGLDFAQKS